MARYPVWAWVVAVGVLAFSVLFFFQYKDPMILIFGVIAGAMVLGVTAMMRGGTMGGGMDIRVRCRECRALNPEDAKFCAQCGRQV